MSAIATPIILTVMLSFLVLGTAAVQQMQAALAYATRHAATVANDRVLTQVEIVEVEYNDVDLSVQVLNRGGVAITDYRNMDILVDYTAGGGGRVVSRLTFTTGAYGSGNWRINRLVPDGLHPGLWNPGETLTIQGRLPDPVDVSDTATVVVATPNGQTASAYFVT
jgi:hypothetical protein